MLPPCRGAWLLALGPDGAVSRLVTLVVSTPERWVARTAAFSAWREVALVAPAEELTALVAGPRVHHRPCPHRGVHLLDGLA